MSDVTGLFRSPEVEGIRDAIVTAVADGTPRQIGELLVFIDASEKLTPTLEELNQALADLVSTGALVQLDRMTVQRAVDAPNKGFSPLEQRDYEGALRRKMVAVQSAASARDSSSDWVIRGRTMYENGGRDRPTSREMALLREVISGALTHLEKAGLQARVPWMSVGPGYVEIPVLAPAETNDGAMADLLKSYFDSSPLRNKLKFAIENPRISGASSD